MAHGGLLYLETTIPSYLTAARSGSPEIEVRRQATVRWWKTERSSFRLFISQFVLNEMAAGDRTRAKDRLDAVRDIPLLPISDDVTALAAVYVDLLEIPPRATTDALHLALVVAHEIDFLLTWNCRHLANGRVLLAIKEYNLKRRLFLPVIVTPMELMPAGGAGGE